MSVENISLEVYAASRWAEVRPLWARIAEASPYASFFLLPDWIECWLATSTAGLKVDILLFRHEQTAVGACLLVEKTVRRGGIPIRRLYLNAAGEESADETFMEYNTLLCLEGWETAVAARFEEHVRGLPWDELLLPGCAPGRPVDAVVAAFAGCEAVPDTHASYYVDLEAIRQSGKTYEEALGQTTRKHLRQNLRHYAKLGPLETQVSESMEEALAMLGELAALHQESWTRRGQPGVFASRSFTAFHEALIRQTFPWGGTRIFRVTAGEVVGLIYAFVYGGRVYFYQSGLRYTDDKRLSPGQVVNACAIVRCLEMGHAEYDFLAGDAPYKRSLGTARREMVWISIRRPSWKWRTIEALGSARNAVREGIGRMRSGAEGTPKAD